MKKKKNIYTYISKYIKKKKININKSRNVNK